MTPEEIKAKHEEFIRAFEAFKANNEKQLEEIKKLGAPSADSKERLEKIEAGMKAYEDMLAKMQTALNRVGAGVDPAVDPDKKRREQYRKSFLDFVRKGHESFVIDGQTKSLKELSREEAKTLSVQIDEDGGFLVSPEVSSEVVKKLHESSPIRGMASVVSISSDSLDILEDLGRATVGWVGETQARPNTATPQLNMLKIPVHEIYANPLATQKILDDAAFNIEAWLAEKIAEEFSLEEATQFVSGNGVNKPKGFLSYANGTSFGTLEQTETANSGAIGADDMLDLIYSLKTGYVKNANLVMRRATIKVLRKLKDENGQYLWAPGLVAGAPSTFNGSPIVEFADMPAVAASALAVAFGDFKKGYQIVDRIGIRVLRDPYTNKPHVSFYTTKRVGGGVKDFDAIKILKVKA